MTQHQRSELDKAIERAHREGLVIVARGVVKGSGLRLFWVAPLDDLAHQRCVQVTGQRLTCECPARVVCKHRGLIHETLEREERARQAEIERTNAATSATLARISRSLDARDALDQTALAHRRETSPVSYGAARPFSLFK